MVGLNDVLKEYMELGDPVVLLTVFARTGSAPRGAGAHMVVAEKGRVFGTIGGGAVEYEAEQRAAKVLREKTSCLEHYYLNPNKVQDLGMVCGGEVDVAFSYLDPAKECVKSSIKAWNKMTESGEAVWLILDVTSPSGGGLAVYGKHSGFAGMAVPASVTEKMLTAFSTVEIDGRNYYCERVTQSGKVYVFGGGHVAQALVPALAAVDFTCVVLEDREEFCKAELFPEAEKVLLIDTQRIGDFVEIGEEDYVCVMTRGHKDDTIVQEQILKTPASYIGVIGSRRKKAKVFEELKKSGFTDRDLERITTPIGLEIQAETPAEIAVSITAQLIQVRAKASMV